MLVRGASPAPRAPHWQHPWVVEGGGGNTVSSSHEEATDIHGGGSTMRLGSPKSPASPAPAEQSLLSLLFRKKRQFFFRRPPAEWGFGWAGAGKGAQLCPRSPARTPSLPPSKGILQLQHGMGSLASPLPKPQEPPVPLHSGQNRGWGFPSPPCRCFSPPQQQGFSPYQKKKVNIVQSKGREGLRRPPGPLGRAGPTARFCPGAGRHLPSDGWLEEGLSRTRPGHRPTGGRRTDTKAGQRTGAKVPCGVSLPLEPVQSWSLCPGGFPLSSHPQPDFAVMVQPAPGARNAPGGGVPLWPPQLSPLRGGSLPPPTCGSTGPGAGQGQPKSECDEGRTHPVGCNTPPAPARGTAGRWSPSGRGSQRDDATSRIVAWHPSSSNGPFPPPGQRSWGGEGAACPHTPTGHFPPPPGLHNELEPMKDPGRVGTRRGFTISGRVRGGRAGGVGGRGVSGLGASPGTGDGATAHPADGVEGHGAAAPQQRADVVDGLALPAL